MGAARGQVRGSGNHGILVDRGAGAGGTCAVSGVRVEACENGESGVVVLGCRAALRDSLCSFNGADGGEPRTRRTASPARAGP